MVGGAAGAVGVVAAPRAWGGRQRRERPQIVERFNRTLVQGWAYRRQYPSEAARRAAFSPWLHWYNHHRPHTALGGRPPITRCTNLPEPYT